MNQLLTAGAAQVVRLMNDYGLWLWGDLSRTAPFCVVQMAPRQAEVRKDSGELPAAQYCSELHERGLIEMGHITDGGKGRYFWLSESGFALARTL